MYLYITQKNLSENIGILEEIVYFIDRKWTSWKYTKKLGRALQVGGSNPSIAQNPKENIFSQDNIPEAKK